MKQFRLQTILYSTQTSPNLLNSTRKAQQAIKVLINAHFVTQTKRTGRTDEYRVTPVSEWVPKEELDEILTKNQSAQKLKLKQ